MVKSLVTIFVGFLPVVTALGWSEPHQAITKAALQVLSVPEKSLLGDELAALGSDYCLIPDHVYTDRNNAKFAMMDSHPGEKYLLFLHLPSQPTEYLEALRYFMEKAVGAIQAGNMGDAARFMGTICHLVEDYGSPAHTIPGDNMFTLLQQFLPPPEHMKHQLLHSPIESGVFEVSIAGYQPCLLGTNVNEASWRLMHRVHEGILNARSTTIPIIQALYAKNTDAVRTEQMKAATVDAQVVADALHTILALGAAKFEASETVPLERVAIGAFFPLEAPSLYFPQKTFFSAPYWGHVSRGVVLEKGEKEVPIKLKIQDNNQVSEREFADGISAGGRSTLTYVLPAGVYRKFKVYVGLQAQLGADGAAEFVVSGDDKQLVSVTLKGDEPARYLECDLEGVTNLQLVTTGRGSNPKSNYAIWAEPILSRE